MDSVHAGRSGSCLGLSQESLLWHGNPLLHCRSGSKLGAAAITAEEQWRVNELSLQMWSILQPFFDPPPPSSMKSSLGAFSLYLAVRTRSGPPLSPNSSCSSSERCARVPRRRPTYWKHLLACSRWRLLLRRCVWTRLLHSEDSLPVRTHTSELQASSQTILPNQMSNPSPERQTWIPQRVCAWLLFYGNHSPNCVSL